MVRIALLSDTHNYLDSKIFKYFDDCDQIWHAGDIGTIAIADQLAKIKPLIAVYGNIDGADVRKVHPLHQSFMCEQVKVLITHIGGYPTRYSFEALEEIKKNKPQLFISGHSHILKVMYDEKYKLLHINPGAAGNHGFHHVKTMVRFTVDGDKIKDLEVIELGKRA
ncbi:MAG: metallophosphoesterase family protein [Bacteroidetes bacterium]|nr:metallophosphoesterase family protein [Bacteroidota bacterium]